MTPGRPAQGEKRKQMDEEEAATQANTHAIFVSAAPTKINKRSRKKMAWRTGARTKESNEARGLSRQLAFLGRQEDSKRVRRTAIDLLHGCLRSRKDLIGLLIAPAATFDAEVTPEVTCTSSPMLQMLSSSASVCKLSLWRTISVS